MGRGVNGWLLLDFGVVFGGGVGVVVLFKCEVCVSIFQYLL